MSRPGPEFEYGASLSCHIVAATEMALSSQAGQEIVVVPSLPAEAMTSTFLVTTAYWMASFNGRKKSLSTFFVTPWSMSWPMGGNPRLRFAISAPWSAA